jgi:hypothetical protein
MAWIVLTVICRCGRPSDTVERSLYRVWSFIQLKLGSILSITAKKPPGLSTESVVDMNSRLDEAQNRCTEVLFLMACGFSFTVSMWREAELSPSRI